ncbi:TetR-like C-terminal domain-containing protein [Antarcticirhabdus aurantiaca]|uniref:TetR-like C-terminal domain-containing protein n=1 Tax=Antarcticirhabdus aurantiaca TaxID=2606717 RepID=A0ACD4NSE3_9HYPH|nr:TetR-like C-terminal domain-containing protein [Antarcticirhabdus aurantiaca]WAJ29805.1 TetR-like C-terminal domain-containing protein [Jeongeuplla avenae]
MPATSERTERRGQAGRGGYHHGDLRAALLAAAEAELAENGLAGFSLRATARRAGVSHAAPAHHFASADALLAALAVLGFERLVAAMEAAIAAAGGSARARLAAAGRGYVAFARANPHLFRLMFFGKRPEKLAPDGVPQAPGRAFAMLRQTVADVLGPGASEAEIARAIAAAWGLVHGLAHLLIEGAAGFLQPFPPAEREAIVADAIDRFAASLGAGSV